MYEPKKKRESDRALPGSTEYLYGMTKDEYLSGLNTINIKSKENDELQKKIDAFVEAGGVIEKMPYMKSGRTFDA